MSWKKLRFPASTKRRRTSMKSRPNSLYRLVADTEIPSEMINSGVGASFWSDWRLVYITSKYAFAPSATV